MEEAGFFSLDELLGDFSANVLGSFDEDGLFGGFRSLALPVDEKFFVGQFGFVVGAGVEPERVYDGDRVFGCCLVESGLAPVGENVVDFRSHPLGEFSSHERDQVVQVGLLRNFAVVVEVHRYEKSAPFEQLFHLRLVDFLYRRDLVP